MHVYGLTEVHLTSALETVCRDSLQGQTKAINLITLEGSLKMSINISTQRGHTSGVWSTSEPVSCTQLSSSVNFGQHQKEPGVAQRFQAYFRRYHGCLYKSSSLDPLGISHKEQ